MTDATFYRLLRTLGLAAAAVAVLLALYGVALAPALAVAAGGMIVFPVFARGLSGAGS